MKKALLASAFFSVACIPFAFHDASATTSCKVTIGDAEYSSINTAVTAAQPGDILKVYPGACDIARDDVTMVQGQAGWYLPIEKSITIMGVDASGNEITNAGNTAATLYSSTYSENGAWASQNLITVFADNVTISGLTIMDKPGGNKTIEVAETSSTGVKNFTVKNVTFAPLAKEYITDAAAVADGYASVDEYWADYSEYGAALYISGAVENTQIIDNLFLYSGLTFDHPNQASIVVRGNAFEGVKHWSDDPNYIYYSIGHRNWTYEGGPVGLMDNDLTDFDLTVVENLFLNAGKIDFSRTTKGYLDFNNNYWNAEYPDFSTIIKETTSNDVEVDVSAYYAGLNQDGTINKDSLYIFDSKNEGFSYKYTTLTPSEQGLVDAVDIEGLQIPAAFDVTVADHIEGEVVDFLLPIPMDAREVPENYTRTYYVIRIHDGVATVLEPTVIGNELLVSSDKFSTYVVAYADTAKIKAPDTGYNTEKSSASLLAVIALSTVLSSIIVIRKRRA